MRSTVRFIAQWLLTVSLMSASIFVLSVSLGNSYSAKNWAARSHPVEGSVQLTESRDVW